MPPLEQEQVVTHIPEKRWATGDIADVVAFLVCDWAS